LRDRVRAAVEEREDLARLNVIGKKSMIGKSAMAFDVKVNIASVTKRAR